MKTRKNIITILTLCAALSLTACSGKDTTEKNPKKNEKYYLRYKRVNGCFH